MQVFFRFALALTGAACTAAAAQVVSLTDLSLDQLSRIEVTSVGKRLQRVADVAGSVYVIHTEDIRRSGATSIPEVLRLAPNLQVARVDAVQYAISARSGADLLANKMLVLVDGRTIYSPLFSGVFWEIQDMPLDDIERIEVLSGAGGTLYGSNAVHGVINIVTRNAAETAGTLVKGAAGTQERFATLRYGQAGESGSFRLYGKKRQVSATERANGSAVRDATRQERAGFRWDGGTPQQQLTAIGELFHHEAQDSLGSRDYRGGHVLARLITDEGGRRTQYQAYLDRVVRDRSNALRNTVDTLDVEVQRQQAPLAGLDLLWGAGARLYRDDAQAANPAALDFVPRKRDLRLWNLFAQAEFEATASSIFTFGLKAEHNDYTGLELLPTLRYAWKPADGHIVWAAASRVVRTPARVDRDAASPPLVPSPDFDSERARIAELGWRGRFSPSLSAAATVFAHRFEDLRSFDVVGTRGTFGNNYSGRLHGAEGWLEWRPTDSLRIKAGYLSQRPTYAADPGTAPLPASTTLGNDARTNATLGLAWDLRQNVWIDVQARHIGSRPNPAVPSYAALDARIGWRPVLDVEVSAAVRNLTRRQHVEWGAAATASQLPRTALVQVVWWR